MFCKYFILHVTTVLQYIITSGKRQYVNTSGKLSTKPSYFNDLINEILVYGSINSFIAKILLLCSTPV